MPFRKLEARKARLFLGLSAKEAISTWDNLQKRYWQGLVLCPLCGLERKKLVTFLLSYAFAKDLRSKCISKLNVNVDLPPSFNVYSRMRTKSN